MSDGPNSKPRKPDERVAGFYSVISPNQGMSRTDRRLLERSLKRRGRGYTKKR